MLKTLISNIFYFTLPLISDKDVTGWKISLGRISWWLLLYTATKYSWALCKDAPSTLIAVMGFLLTYIFTGKVPDMATAIKAKLNGNGNSAKGVDDNAAK